MDILLEEEEIKIEYYESFESDPLCKRRAQSIDEYEAHIGDLPCVGLQEPGSDDNAEVESAVPINIKSVREGTILSDIRMKPTTEVEETWFKSINTSGRYQCRFCNLSYLTIQTVRHHVKLKHIEEAKKLKDTIMKNKRKSKQKCHICKRRFKTATELQSHVKTEHNFESVKFSCFFCNASFSDSKEISDHIYLKHDKDIDSLKIKYCDVCGYRTLKKSHFIQHQNSHLIEKSLKCNVCDYSTNRKANLKIHERLHTDQKPYLCNVQGCGYKSSAKSALRSHRLKHFSDENMLFCDKCSYKTVYSQSLKKHIRSHLNNSVKIKII